MCVLPTCHWEVNRDGGRELARDCHPAGGLGAYPAAGQLRSLGELLQVRL